MQGAKPFNIDRWLIFEAFKSVKSNKGSAGIDGVTIEQYEANLKQNLYKLWNRMSSGSYLPKSVRLVEIPKSNGGKRPLGIPTVEDRIAQMAAVKMISPILEPNFHDDSYAYRPNRSAHHALAKARTRCWEYDWVLDMDISKFFDTIDHELLMKAVKCHIQERWVLLYIERWLKVSYETLDGKVTEREMGVPQGSVIGPVLANLFLHYCFDKWMTIHHPEIPFERYADDTICHCRTKYEAETLNAELRKRFAQCKLKLNEEKTKIVYCKDNRRRGYHDQISFDFLGYTFRPRKTMNKAQHKAFTRFLPAISNKSKKKIKDEIRSWNLRSKAHTPLDLIAKYTNPVIKGWMNYYGKFEPMEMKLVMMGLNVTLAQWAKAKYKHFRRKPWIVAYKWLGDIARRSPMFYHWQLGVYPKNV